MSGERDDGHRARGRAAFLSALRGKLSSKVWAPNLQPLPHGDFGDDQTFDLSIDSQAIARRHLDFAGEAVIRVGKSQGVVPLCIRPVR